MTLAELIAPISIETFLAEHWERKPLHVSQRAPLALAGTPLWLEEKLALLCAGWGDVSLARAGTDPADCPYIKSPPDIAAIERAFAENYTIVVNDMQKKDAAVALLCRALERELFCRANVNLYLTNRNGHGLAYHYDDDDVFILQLKGEKSWRIYEPRAELPLGNTPYACPDCAASPFRTYELREGDVFYLPRGFVHEAMTADTVSLHLTVSLNVVRWAQLVKEAVQLAAESDVALRRAVPAALLRRGALDGERPPVPADLLQAPGLLGAALGRVQDTLLAGVQRLATRELTAARRAVSTDTRVRVGADQIGCLAPMADGFVLKGVGTSIEFSGGLAPVAPFLLTATCFSALDLPGDIPLRARLDIVRRLVENGYLVFAD